MADGKEEKPKKRGPDITVSPRSTDTYYVRTGGRTAMARRNQSKAQSESATERRRRGY